jgi:enoyl-CoA hydratase/carnithine racemase
MTIRSANLNGVATIEIARPQKKNAITGAMYGELAAAFEAATVDATVRAVLITGQPDIFTSGNDVEDFMNRPPSTDGQAELDSPAFGFMRAMMACDKPIVAGVTGAAIGIGTTLLLHCDLVYVADDSRLAMPFVALGLVPEFASSVLAPRLMGSRRAAEKILLGDPFSGPEAVEFGIANAVLPSAEVVPHARRVAERFNALPPGAVRATKRLLQRADRQLLAEAIGVEGKAFGERLQSPEAKEAFSAFLGKRKPDFSRF